VVAGVFLAAVQLVTLFVGTPTLPYAFLSIVLIATSGVIAWFAWKWSSDEVSQEVESQPFSAATLAA
jgi:membrane protein implicated in regulation of membrane protease activity